MAVPALYRSPNVNKASLSPARPAALPIIPGFNDTDTLRTLKEQNIAVVADGTEFGILPDDLEQALIKQDTSELEQKISEWGSHGRPDAYTYWGKIVEFRMQNAKKAFTWYKKAADAGDAEGAFYVAKAYCEGSVDKTKSNSIDCYKWLNIAKANAKEPLLSVVQDAIKTVEEQISPEEKAAALKQAKAVTPAQETKKKRSFKLF